MRLGFFLPRIFGVRPFVSLGHEELARFRSSPNAGNIEGGFVYVATGGHNLTKIGISSNPNARLAQLQTGSGFPIRLAHIFAVDGDMNRAAILERGAHQTLSRHQTNGEWFDIQPEMACAALAASSSRLGIKTVEVEPGQIGEILKLAASGSAEPRGGSPVTKTAVFMLQGIAGGVLALVVAFCLWIISILLKSP